MPRSDWRVLIALAGLALVVWAFAQGILIGLSYYPTEERYQPYRYTAAKPSEVQPTAAGQTIAQSLQYRTPCRDPQGEGESDLCAQWKAANAAADGAYWAKWGFWIACIGSAFLLWQIILTRKAVEDTSEATDAMREANKIAREGQERQLRAYVNVTKIGVTPFIPGAAPTFMLELLNTGATPARDVRLISQPFFYALDGPEPQIRFKPLTGEGSRMSLAPNQPIPHPNQLLGPLPEIIAAALNNGQHGVIYAGVVIYLDVFGRQHRTTFKARFERDIPIEHGFRCMGACSDGNVSN